MTLCKLELSQWSARPYTKAILTSKEGWLRPLIVSKDSLD